MSIRLLVVDDHPVVRAGMAAVLSEEPDFDVVGQAHEGREDVGVEEVLGQVDVQVGAVEGELPGTVRVALEGAPQVRGVCRVQALEVVPGWRGSGIDKAHTASLCPLAWTG